MIKKIILSTVILMTAVIRLSAQHPQSSMSGAEMCSHRKTLNTQLPARSFRSANSPKHAFDVLKYSINIDLVNCFQNPFPKGFNADVKVLFRIDSVLNQIVLDAVNSSITVSEVQMSGVAFIHSGDKLSIQLDRTYNPGEQAEVKIIYSHNNVTDGAFYASGGYVFTDCEPEGARKWFPCYDRPGDKALTDITAKVPVGTKLGSNGRLQDSISDGSTITYHWISRDPVATYLAVITASNNYNLDVVNWTNPNTAEIIPIRFYYNIGENPGYIESIIGDMTSYFSEEFGDHPFEKNGFATLNNEFAWGGMENQTLTSLCQNCWYESLIAHEYAHQWFGDMITCATWADIFLNEGFATWAEAYWNEGRNGYQAYKTEMNNNASVYFSGNPHWAISNPDWAVNTPGVNTLFNYSITYMKGSCVLHMLRYTLGDDVFFPALKAYATDTVDFKNQSATIEDFKNKIETESGQELDWFFDQWIYKPDHPTYKNVYGIHKSNGESWSVVFTAKQEEVAFLPYFQMPLELTVDFKDGSDTTIRVFNSFNGQSFAFEFDKEPTHLTFDKNNQILLKEGNTTVGMEESVTAENAFKLKVSPNPFTNHTKITFKLNVPEFATLELYNSTGQKLKVISEDFYSATDNTIELVCDGLQNGIYFVVFRTAHQTESVKMIKAQ